LTAAEQMRLDQLAQHLREDDPQLAEALSSPGPAPRKPATASRGALLAGAVTAAAALVVLAAVVGGPGGAAALVVTLLSALAGWWLVQRHRRTRN
jgi:Flp pilus assembly protein TadB